MKVALNYDPNSGNVTTNDGMFIGCCMGLNFEAHSADAQSKGIAVESLTKLKDAGFDAAEIIDLHRRGVLAG